MKKTIWKAAAAGGLCLALLAGCGAAETTNTESTTNELAAVEQQMPTTGGNWQNGPFGQMGGMPGQTGTQNLASEASTVAEGNVTNSAALLEADYSSAVTIVMSDENNEVKIKESGTYIVTGSCADGSITVTKGTTGVVLVLKDLDLTSTDGAPLSVNKEAEVKIVVSGSVTLTDSEDPADEDSTDAAVADAFDGAAIKIKAGASVCITGAGTLTVNGTAKNGIKSGDETVLVIDGELTINITAANDAINGNYDVAILGGTLNVSAGDDAIHADRILTVGTESGGPSVTIAKCSEGLEGTVVNIAGGTVSVTASDDGVNAADSDGAFADELTFSINMTGGSLTVNAGADGLDSNGNVNLIGGSASIRSAYNGGDAGIDYDGALYISDDFELDNQSGVAGPDGMGGMPGQMSGMPGQQDGMNGQMGGMPGQQGGMNGQMGGMPGQQGGMSEQNGSMPGRPDGASGQMGGRGQHGGMPGQSGAMPESPDAEPGTADGSIGG